MDLRTVARDMRLASSSALQIRHGQVGSVAGKLNALSPLATLSRGYSIARSLDGRTLASASDFSEGDSFELMLNDGKIRATAGKPVEGAS
jgi:exodeoxyribonuclease VII large subunit